MTNCIINSDISYIGEEMAGQHLLMAEIIQGSLTSVNKTEKQTLYCSTFDWWKCAEGATGRASVAAPAFTHSEFIAVLQRHLLAELMLHPAEQ